MYFSQLNLGATRAARVARPFEGGNLALRLAPFVGLTLVTLIIVPFAFGGMNTELLISWVTLGAIVGSAFLVPWSRLPASWQGAPPLLFYLIAALIRDSSGGGESVFTALILLPVVWFALYGTINQVLWSVAGCFAAIGLPVLLEGPPAYPARELGRAALDSVMTGALGVTGVHLMDRTREREEVSRSILDSTHEAFIAMDGLGHIVEWSLQAERDFGWGRSEVLGKPLVEAIVPAADVEHYQPGLERMLAGDPQLLNRKIEITAQRRNGTRFPIELSFARMGTGAGARFNAFVHDISSRRESEDALNQANQRFRSAFDDAAIGMAIVSPDGRWMRANRALAELTGYPIEQLVGKAFADITHPDDLPKDVEALQEMLDGVRDRFQTEKRYIHADGRVIWVSLSTTIVRDSAGGPLYLLSQMQDIGERKQTEAALAHRASHDDLTGLPNRSLLEDRLVLALNRQRRERKPVAILYLDLDGFKDVNDTHGHDAGDFVLVAVAKRLTALVRPMDVVSRLGGDEFAVLCEGMDEAAATKLAKRIVEVVPKPIDAGGIELTVAPSVGISLTREPATKPADLVADADVAMYFAKDQSEFGYAFYEDDLHPRSGRGAAANVAQRA
jgi:diguanylate cyclase (GGDEF)-like protein/PAS domain S-box-containing protein